MSHGIVLAMHGVDQTRTGYSERLQQRVQDAKPPGLVDWWEIQWAGEIQGLVRNYRQWLETPRGRRRWFGITDLLYNVSSWLFNYLGPSGESVRSKVKEDLTGYSSTHLDGQEHWIDIVAHSLGSVIIFDMLWEAEQACSSSGTGTIFLSDGRVNWKLRNLFTMGSPLGLLSLYYPGKFSDYGKPIPINFTGKWINFYDLGDPIAYPLERVINDPTATPPSLMVKDQVVKNKGAFLNPGKAHGGYWTSPTVAREMIMQMGGKT